MSLGDVHIDTLMFTLRGQDLFLETKCTLACGRHMPDLMTTQFSLTRAVYRNTEIKWWKRQLEQNTGMVNAKQLCTSYIMQLYQ